MDGAVAYAFSHLCYSVFWTTSMLQSWWCHSSQYLSIYIATLTSFFFQHADYFSFSLYFSININSPSTKILIRKWEISCGGVEDNGKGQKSDAYGDASPS